MELVLVAGTSPLMCADRKLDSTVVERVSVRLVNILVQESSHTSSEPLFPFVLQVHDVSEARVKTELAPPYGPSENHF